MNIYRNDIHTVLILCAILISMLWMKGVVNDLKEEILLIQRALIVRVHIPRDMADNK